jgi:hypothetical protein
MTQSFMYPSMVIDGDDIALLWRWTSARNCDERKEDHHQLE